MTRLVPTAHGVFRTYDDSIGQALAAGKFWDVQLQPTIDATAKLHPEEWAIDLGANIGWFTVYLAHKFAHVVAVEAHPHTFQILTANLKTHGVRNHVTLLQAAAYNQACLLSLARPEWHGWAIPDPDTLEGTASPSSVGFVPDPVPWGIQVPALALGPYLNPDTPIALIKSDVQGCDLYALQGLYRTIRTWRPTILFEVEDGMQAWHGDTRGIAAFEEYLEPLGYQIRRIWRHHWDYVAVHKDSPLVNMNLTPPEDLR